MLIITQASLNLQWSMRNFLHVPPTEMNPPHKPAWGQPAPSKVMPVIRNGLPSTPCNSKGTMLPRSLR
jgi:hypothetical protein